MLEVVLLQAGKPGGWLQILPWIGIFVVFYFFMIRPQQKKAKEQKQFRESLKKGDQIVTIGGLYGRIASIEDDNTILVEVDKGIKLKFEKSAVSADSSKKLQDTESK
jgi:preprotein translocase subunit YajC